jgi:hypothetical protein
MCYYFIILYYFYCKSLPSGDKKKGLATSTKDFVREKKLQIAIFRL